MSFGGGGGSGSKDSRTAIIQSEKEQLQELERRMTVYDTLFGDVEQDLIKDSLGVLNSERLATHTEKLNTGFERQKVLESGMASDAAYIKKYTGKDISTSPSVGGTLKGIGDFWSGDITGGWMDTFTGGSSSAKKKEKKIKKRLRIASTRYQKNANELAQIEQDRVSTTEALQNEIKTQQKNSKLEQTEQGRTRASGTVDTAFKQSEEITDLRDQGYGTDPTKNVRSEEEQQRELALMKAAAEAGARNKAKSDIDALAKAKLGAITGGDLVDRQASEQLNSLSKSYLSRSGQSADMARAAGQQGDAATMAAIQGVGSMAGTVFGYGLSQSRAVNTPSQLRSANTALNTNPSPAVVDYSFGPGKG